DAIGAAGERGFVFEERDFQRVCRMIHARAGISLGPHKRDMVYSRLARRLRARGIERFADYLDLVERDADGEDEQFVNALTTNLTSFFREAHHFPLLASQLRAMYRRGQSLLVWCCAASTGEEPYSLAITACEAFDSPTPPVRILATDIDTSVLQVAARGVRQRGPVPVAPGAARAGRAAPAQPARARLRTAAGLVRGGVLPQRDDLLRQAHPVPGAAADHPAAGPGGPPVYRALGKLQP